MSVEKFSKLVKALAEQSEEGRLKWEESVEPGVYQVSFPNYSVKIREEFGEEPEPDIVITIHNAEGATLDRFTDRDLHSYMVDNFHVRSYTTMDAIFQKARRTAMGSEQALDSILKFLS